MTKHLKMKQWPLVIEDLTSPDNWTNERHSSAPYSRRVKYTDGVKCVLERGGADWLLRDIMAAQDEKVVTDMDYQIWTLRVNADRSAALTCIKPCGTALHTITYELCDFPLKTITLWLKDDLLLVPSQTFE